MIRPVVLALTFLGAAACSSAPSPIPVGTDRPYFGHIREGEKFGVAIGQPASEAQRIMSRRFEYRGRHGCAYTFEQLAACAEGDVHDSFSVDEPFRRGGVYMVIEQDRVVAIVWRMYPLPHLDF